MALARRPHATPSSRRRIAKTARSIGPLILRYRFHIVVDLAVAALVLALPLAVRGGAVAATPSVEPQRVASVAQGDGLPPRAQTVGRALSVSDRGGAITPAARPDTQLASDVKPIPEYKLGPSDTLQSIAAYYEVSPEAIAASNGITDPTLAGQAGRTILIPPGEGVLYTVRSGDTIASVAKRWGVDPKVVMDYNRLYFEPEHFAPDQLIFVPGAQVPNTFVYVRVGGGPGTITRPPAQLDPTPNGRLQIPVRDYAITQYFWALHTGVDLAVPYGTPIAASDDGIVESAGWVAVGGLGVQIAHAGGLETGYYHMSAIYVTPGQRVKRGEIIGAVGLTGVTTGPHVHWEVKLAGRFVNPLQY